MIPQNKITETPLITEYLYEKPTTRLIDRALGGISLQNISQGLTYQLWEIFYEAPLVRLKGLTTHEIITLEEIPGVTEVSVAFDLNMNVTYAYVVNGISYLKYYDVNTSSHVLYEIPESISPRLAYDDLRITQVNSSDIVCAYINKTTNTMCYRLLRDLYSIEYPLHEVPENARLIRVAMSKGRRLQFRLQLIKS